MRLTQFHGFSVFLVLAAVAHGCTGVQLHSYIDQLECGMTLEQVRAISAVQIKAVGEHRIGNYRANFGRDSVWLAFSDEGLQSATAQKISGLASARLSPKKNLCTSKLTYFVSLEWLAELQELNIYLDGELVAKGARSGLVLEVSGGEHVIRLERPGIVPIQRRIMLDKDSFGDQWLDIEDFERMP